jgi:hypothetical protein
MAFCISETCPSVADSIPSSFNLDLASDLETDSTSVNVFPSLDISTVSVIVDDSPIRKFIC